MTTRKEVQAIIVKKGEEGYRVLVLDRFNGSAGVQQYRFVKGGIEQGEQDEEALRREISEEVGITAIERVAFLRRYSFTAGDITHEVTVYVVPVASDAAAVPDSSHEGSSIIRAALWMTPDEAMQMLTFAEEKRSLAEAVGSFARYV